MMRGMSVQLLVVADCPNERRASNLLSDAVRLLGWSGEFVETITIASMGQAEAWGFSGSPSFFLNGVDVLPGAGGEPALACRVHRSATASVAGCTLPLAVLWTDLLIQTAELRGHPPLLAGGCYVTCVRARRDRRRRALTGTRIIGSG